MTILQKLGVKLTGLVALLCVAHVSRGWSQLTQSSFKAENELVTIRVVRPDAPQEIPHNLFGSFLEPIGHSTYGGLWANVVENPSFEEGLWSAENIEAQWKSRPELRAASSLGLSNPWVPLEPAQGSRYAPVRGDAANSAQSLLLMGLPGKEVGIMQQVYLPVHRELRYRCSLWLKHVEGDDPVTVSLRPIARPTEVLTAGVVQRPSAVWTKHSFYLELKAGQLRPLEPVNLVISVEGDSRVLLDNISVEPEDAVDGMDPEVLALARDLHSPMVRFGGNFTSAYDWHDGVGPIDKRVSKLNLAWGIPEYNTFGTEEFLHFCELIHAKPQIALNMGTGTASEAAEWVRFVNSHWADHRGGLTWELGNELWGDYQVGYPPLALAAARTRSYSEAVHQVDPSARLIATGGDAGVFQEWNAQQYATPTGTFTYLSSHFIFDENVLLPGATNEFRTMSMLALPWGLSERIHAMKQQAVDAHRPDVRFAFTEWLMAGTDAHNVPNYSNAGGAIFAGGFLNAMIRNSADVSIANMTGILDFGGISKKRGKVYASPAYWVLRTYANANPGALLRVESNSPTFSISHGITQLPEVSGVPYLDVVAAKSETGGSVVLLCVNRQITHSESAIINLTSIGVNSGSARVTTIAGDDVFASNDEYNPSRVVAVTRTQHFTAEQSYTFPRASVTVIEVPLNVVQ